MVFWLFVFYRHFILAMVAFDTHSFTFAKIILTLLYYQRSEKLCKNVITMFQQFQKARELKKILKLWYIRNLQFKPNVRKIALFAKTIATFWFFIFFSDCWQPTHCFWMLNLAKMNLKFVPVKILSIFQIRPISVCSFLEICNTNLWEREC